MDFMLRDLLTANPTLGVERYEEGGILGFEGFDVVGSWLPGMLQHTGRRLRGVRIECDTYDKTLIDASNTVAVLDPPYMPETRVAQNKYLHEFGRKEHQHLLQVVRRLKKTRVLLCGYRGDLYDNELRKFRRVDIKANSCVGPTMRGRKRPSRVLSIWMNYA